MNTQSGFPLGVIGLIFLLSKGLLQHHNLKISILWHSGFLMIQLSNPYTTTGKTTALTRWTFVGKVMPLLFNILSRFVIVEYCAVLCLVAELCPSLCDPLDYSPPGSSVQEIFQARILKWLPFPFPEDLPNPGIKSASPALQVDSLLMSHWGSPTLKDIFKILFFF